MTSDGVTGEKRSLKSYGNFSILMHGFHHGVCSLEDIFVNLHVKEATKYESEKHKLVLCQLIILANLLKHKKAVYCLEIHITHTRTQAEILCCYR